MIPKPFYVHKFASENTNSKNHLYTMSIAQCIRQEQHFYQRSNYLELRTTMKQLFKLQNLSVHTKAEHVFGVVKITVFSKPQYRGLEKQ